MAPFVYRLLALILTMFGVWCVAALFIDFRVSYLQVPLAIIFAAGFCAALIHARRHWLGLLECCALVAFVLTWWFSLTPTNIADWQPDVSRMPESRVKGDGFFVSNVRSCGYHTEFDYQCRWEDRNYSLQSLRAVDFFLTEWGAPLIAHVMVSFDFGSGTHLAFSIEARKRKGQTYSATLGFFRQYGLIYLAADERDVVRLRTNYRQGESVYLYRTRTTPADARALLLEFGNWMNETKLHPRWYNALTENCNRSIVRFLAEKRIGGISRWDWRTFFNGESDRMLFDLGDLMSAKLPFDDLRRQALINSTAKKANDSGDFSALIRTGRAGF